VGGERRDRLWRLIAERDAARSGHAGHAVCDVCVAVVEEVDGAAITIRTTARAQEMLAASEPWAASLEELQYTMGEGPGVEAFERGAPVLHGDLLVEGQRWPVFADAAVERGVAAVFAFPLRIGAIKLGTLDLYSRRSGALSPPGLADAAVLTDLATVALMEWAAQAERAAESGMMHRPDRSYQDAHVATGMIAAQLRISIDDAFVRLRAHAFAEGRPLLEVSRDVLARRVRPEEMAD
jgi:hypothetical protein